MLNGQKKDDEIVEKIQNLQANKTKHELLGAAVYRHIRHDASKY